MRSNQLQGPHMQNERVKAEDTTRQVFTNAIDGVKGTVIYEI